jgi:hypothetical protein
MLDPTYKGLYRWTEIQKRFEGKNNLVGAEVGVQWGQMATRMLAWDQIESYWCIDWWRKYDGYDLMRSRTHRVCFHNFLQRASLNADKVRILTLKSEDAAKVFENEFFDWVFIDGNHNYPDVGRDILAWGPKVKMGGYLCGHDYGHKSCTGVKQAVDEIFPTDLVVGDDWTWFVKRGIGNA